MGSRESNRMWNGHKLPEIDDNLLDLFGYVMAYGHYLYLANFGLLKLHQRAKDFTAQQGVDIGLLKKIIIINLNEGYIKGDPKKTDMTYGLTPIEEDVAGTQNRNFTTAVYKLADKNNKKGYCICENPSCLITLNMIKKLDKNSALKLTNAHHRRVHLSFANMLCSLLREDAECVRRYKICCGESKWLHEYLEENVPLVKLNSRLQMDLVDFTNTGFIMAVQYYFNYLRRILPNLKNRMLQYEKKQWPSKGQRLVPKMIVIVPLSGVVEKKIGDYVCEDGLECAAEFPKYKCMIGIEERVYCASIYKIDADLEFAKDHKNFFCYVEYATPVKQMRAMKKDKVGNFAIIFYEETVQFVFWFRNLLEQNKDDDLVSILVWNDLCEVDGSDDIESDSTHKSLKYVLQERCSELLQEEEA